MGDRQIFRKQAMDRISTPEQLDQFLVVTGPGVWLPLITVVVLLFGTLVWMTLGHVDMTMNVAVVANDSGVVCYVPAEQKDAAVKRGTVSIAGQTYVMHDVGLANQQTEGGNAALLKVDAELMNGVYDGTITVESIHPISWIIN